MSSCHFSTNEWVLLPDPPHGEAQINAPPLTPKRARLRIPAELRRCFSEITSLPGNRLGARLRTDLTGEQASAALDALDRLMGAR